MLLLTTCEIIVLTPECCNVGMKHDARMLSEYLKRDLVGDSACYTFVSSLLFVIPL
jgi:hypothetical protein